MKQKLFSFFISLLISQFLSATGTATIQGSFAVRNNQQSVKIYLSLGEDIFDREPREISMLCKTRSGSFHFDIRFPSDEKFIYVRFEMGNARISEADGIEGMLFIIEPGDHLKVNIDSAGNPVFAGKGSEKIRCQLLMDHEARNMEAVAYRPDYKKIAYNNCWNNELLALNGYKSSLSLLAYKMLFIDNWAELQRNYFGDLIRFGFSDSNFSKILSLRLDTVGAYYLNNIFDSTSELKSRSFCRWTFEKLIFEQKIAKYKNEDEDKNLLVPDNSLYFSIKNNFGGSLREKMLTKFFYIAYEQSSDSELDSEFKQTLETVRTNRYKLILTTLYRRFYLGMPVPQYSFIDSAGHIIKLTDFKNKLVIVDFWFTGCLPCMALGQSLKPIESKFSSNKNVVFVTINVDRDRKMWLRSISAGHYTGASAINLFTGGLGLNHPLIRYYGYDGFPHLLMILNGKIYNGHPPRPMQISSTEDRPTPSTRAFTSIIENFCINKNSL